MSYIATSQFWGGGWVGFHLPQNFGTVIIVLHGVFDKAEAVDVTDEGVAVGSQEVEATHSLLGIMQRC